MFIEVVNEDVEFLERQYADAASHNPDYAGKMHSKSVSKFSVVYKLLFDFQHY